jgi:hypothetical protein
MRRRQTARAYARCSPTSSCRRSRRISRALLLRGVVVVVVVPRVDNKLKAVVFVAVVVLLLTSLLSLAAAPAIRILLSGAKASFAFYC